MAMSAPKTRVRRTDDELVAYLQARIARIERRLEARRRRKNPAVRYIATALRWIVKAELMAKDRATSEALDGARSTLTACLELNRTTLTPSIERALRSFDSATLLGYVRKHPGQRGDQIAAALGTRADAIRPLMHKLIWSGLVRTKGQSRGVTYHPGVLRRGPAEPAGRPKT